ncbi:MAG: organomercurial lyase [candidate division NC10 bacterium]
MAERVFSMVRELDLGPMVQVLNQTWRLLAKGQPVPIERVASALGVSREETSVILRQFGAELDGDGKLVGMGLSLTPTRHRVSVAGTEVPLYTWCVPDAIALAATLGTNVRIESPDPVTGEVVRLTVTPEGVEEVEPKNAVVSFLIPRLEQLQDLRGSVCHYQSLFTSDETAREWFSEGSKEVALLTPSEALELTRLVLAEAIPTALQ